MSFILDALKKLEQEKAVRRSGNINISDEILRGGQRAPRKGMRSLSVTLAVAGLAVALAVAAVVAGAILWSQKDVVKESSQDLERRDARRTVPNYPDPSRLRTAASVPESPPIPAAAPLARQNPVPAEPRPERRPASNPVEKTVATGSGARFEESYQGSSLPAGTDLKVSGIAWQEQRSARRAVINGVLMPEGTSVGGATVKEIFQTRVRFVANGRTFDVSISGPLLGDSSQAAPSRQPVRNDRPSQVDMSLATTARPSMRNDRQTTDLPEVR
ncbi:hypothetical protein EG829_03660 [bacterium]|nr:hypothetical protein [bacterium]